MGVSKDRLQRSVESIEKDGKELIPQDDPGVTFGYDNPRSYLPKAIVELLDEKLPAEGAMFLF